MSTPTTSRYPSPVELANDQVSIIFACRLVGMDVPDDVAYGKSMKLYCPFGPLYHADQGAEPAMRVYPGDNHAFCFAGCGYFTPTWLVAQAFDVDVRVAATDLLDRAGIRPVTLAEAWRQASTWEAPPDRTLLAEALKTFCIHIDATWVDRQFLPPVAETLRRCLALLDHVHTTGQAQEWLDACKIVMRRTLT